MGLLDNQGLSQWLNLFGQNIAIGFVAVAIVAAIWSGPNSRIRRFEPLIIGALFGLCGILSMFRPIQIQPGVILDMRIVFVMIGGLFGGPAGAAVAGVIVALVRLQIGGIGAVSGIGTIITAALVSALVARRYGDRVREFGLHHFAFVGFVGAAIAAVWNKAYFSLAGLPPLPLVTIYSVLIIYPIAAAFLGMAMSVSRFRTWRRSHQRLTDILETSSDLIWEVDASERFTYASERYGEVFDLPPGGILGKKVAELGWRAIDTPTQQTYEAAFSARKPFRQLAFLQRGKAGEPRMISVTGVPIFDSRGHYSGYRGTATDITERESQRSLIAAMSLQVGNAIGEDFLKMLVKSLGEVLNCDIAHLGRFDLEQGLLREQYVYLDREFVSPRTFAYAGLPAEQVARGRYIMVPKGIYESFPPLAKLARFPIEAYAGIPLIGGKGDVLGLISVSGKRPWEAPDYVRSVLNLYAGRAAAELERMIHEEEAAHSRRRTEEVLAALAIERDAIIITDQEGAISYVNRAAIDLLGLLGGLAVGRTLSALGAERGFGDFGHAAVTAADREGEWERTLAWTRPEDGRKFIFEARTRSVPGSGAVTVIVDATHRIKLETDERNRRERQAQASKLEALGNLAGGIAHDFNNLLGAVLGYGQFLLDDLPADSRDRRYAEQIVKVGQRGRSLVQQILAFFRRSDIERTSFRVKDAVAEVQELLGMSLPPTTRLAVENRADDVSILADRGQMTQLLVNLCANASDAMSGTEGSVTISVDRLEQRRSDLMRLHGGEGSRISAAVDVWLDEDGAGHAASGAIPKGDGVSLSVTDSGSGIPIEMLSQIFEPFFTTKAKGKGTGLGLAVVHRIAIEHGGAIFVTTKPGRGTRFEVVLPSGAEPADAPAEPPQLAVTESAAGGGAAVLVVDDDEAYCAMMVTALQRAGYRVRATTDPRTAAEWLKDGSQHWDVLVTDQTMPHMEGLELIRSAKASHPLTRCIICTGFSGGLTEPQAMAAGADALLLKPFRVQDLVNLVTTFQPAESTAG